MQPRTCCLGCRGAAAEALDPLPLRDAQREEAARLLAILT
jgi:hypothetical protein